MYTLVCHGWTLKTHPRLAGLRQSNLSAVDCARQLYLQMVWSPLPARLWLCLQVTSVHCSTFHLSSVPSTYVGHPAAGLSSQTCRNGCPSNVAVSANSMSAFSSKAGALPADLVHMSSGCYVMPLHILLQPAIGFETTGRPYVLAVISSAASLSAVWQ